MKISAAEKWIPVNCNKMLQYLSVDELWHKQGWKDLEVSQDLEICRQFFSSHNWLKTSHLYNFAGIFLCFPYLTNVSSLAGFFSCLLSEVWFLQFTGRSLTICVAICPLLLSLCRQSVTVSLYKSQFTTQEGWYKNSSIISFFFKDRLQQLS